MPEVDLLFIDTKHSYQHLLNELNTYHGRVKRFIMMHDTAHFGINGDDGGPGLIAAIMHFTGQNKQWSVHRQYRYQYGMIVLGCRDEDAPQGPGRELKLMLNSLGITPGTTCDCNERMTAMNDWGVDGCLQNRDTIIEWLKSGQVRWGWRDKMQAAAMAVVTGLAFKLNPIDPFPGLVDECIRLAKEKADAQAAALEKIEHTAGAGDYTDTEDTKEGNE